MIGIDGNPVVSRDLFRCDGFALQLLHHVLINFWFRNYSQPLYFSSM